MTFIKSPLIQLILLVWILIFTPIFIIALKYQHVYSTPATLFSSLCLSLLFAMGFFWVAKLSKVVAIIVTLCLFIFSFLLRLILSFVYDFSGKGFTSEFFAHFGWDSFKIGLTDYGYLFFFALFILLIVLYVITKLLLKIKFRQNKLP